MQGFLKFIFINIFLTNRFTISEEGCARILRHRNSLRTLVQLCKALGTDETGNGIIDRIIVNKIICLHICINT